MSEISRSSSFGKLNSVAFKAIESATVFCKLRGNPYVELVHWISQILQSPDSDMHRIVRHFEVDSSRLAKDITEALDRLPRGATSISDFSTHIETGSLTVTPSLMWASRMRRRRISARSGAGSRSILGGCDRRVARKSSAASLR